MTRRYGQWMALALLLNSTAQAQTEPSLARHHWIYAALQRVEAGAPGQPIQDLGGNTLTAGQAAAHLRRLTESADPRTRVMAASYLELLERQFIGLRAEAEQGWLLRSIGAGGRGSTGLAAPGMGWFRADSARGDDWTGARELPARSQAEAAGTFAVRSAHLAAELAAGLHEGGLSLRGSQAVLGVGKLALWAGNRTLAYGSANTGIVLAGAADFTGGGFYLREPLQAGFLGRFRFETFLSRMDRNGLVAHPWIWGARGSIQPLSNVIMGLNRAAIVGGEGNEPTFRDVVVMVVGGYGGAEGERENQVVSADLRVAVQSTTQPVNVHFEWASDDGSGMWYKAPAITAGIALPFLSFRRQSFASIEGTVMYAKPAKSNTYWYRNVFYRGSWSKDDDVPLGHPLGGHGRELRVTVGSDEFSARLRMQITGSARHRGEENTYSPERAGNSLAAAAQLAWSFKRLEAAAVWAHERGDGWRSRRGEFRLTSFF